MIDAQEFSERYGLDLNGLSEIHSVLGLSADGPFLVGGAVRRLVLKQKQDSDFDVGLSSKEQLEAVTVRLLAMGATQSADTDFYRGFAVDVGGAKREVQLLKIRYGSPLDIISEFDFTICQCAYDGTSIFFGTYTLFDLGRKRLAINKVTFAKSTVRRMLKYANQGFTVCSGCIDSILSEVARNPELAKSDVQYVD